MRNAVRRFGVSEADADDVTQNVFCALQLRWHLYDLSRPLRPWLVAFAHRAASEHRRRSYVRREVLREKPIDPPSEASQVRRLETLADRSAVWQAVEALPAPLREVFVLHELEGVPMPEAAAALGWPLQTCYSRCRAAKRRVARILRRQAVGAKIAAMLAAVGGFATSTKATALSLAGAFTPIKVTCAVLAVAGTGVAVHRLSGAAESVQQPGRFVTSETQPVPKPPESSTASVHAAEPSPSALATRNKPSAPERVERRKSWKVSARRPVSIERGAASQPIGDPAEKEGVATVLQKPPSAPGPTSTLAQEHQLLLRAREQISRSPTASLGLLQRHRARFPEGLLAEEREVLVIRALRKAGKHQRANKRAASFQAKYPQSAHRLR